MCFKLTINFTQPVLDNMKQEEIIFLKQNKALPSQLAKH